MTATGAPRIPDWTLGDRLRKAREHAGMEQGELASRIGVSRNTISNYELGRGQRPPKVIVLRAWAHECGVPYEWLTDGFLGSINRVSTASNRGLIGLTRPGRSRIAPGLALARYQRRLPVAVPA